MAKFRWSDNLKRVYQQFPASIRSKDWPEIVRLANAGEVDKAKEIAKANEQRSKNIRAENVVARRVKLLRIGLFRLQHEAEAELKSKLADLSGPLASAVLKKADSQPGINHLNVKIHDAMVELRSFLNTWIRRLIKQSVIMGFRNMGDALKPIFRDNQEVFSDDLVEVKLIEDRLSFLIHKKLANRAKPAINLDTDQGYRVYNRIVTTILKTNLKGLKPSERIWDLTMRTEQELKKILINGVASGHGPAVISRQIEQYLSPSVLTRAEGLGPGMYRSPFKNAMRIARTETGRAYTNASASWAMEKPWVEGLTVTLSAAHDVEDICDEWAGEPLTPEEFSEKVPFHPHCMCYPTVKIKPEYLVGASTVASKSQTR